MAVTYNNGWQISTSDGKNSLLTPLTNSAREDILKRVETDPNMTAKDLLGAISGSMGASTTWEEEIFGKINAADFLQAYKDGVLPSTADASKAIANGEYIGNKDQYMNEVLSSIFDLDYDNKSGFVANGATIYDTGAYTPTQSQQNIYAMLNGSNEDVAFTDNGMHYTYDPNTGNIVDSNGRVVSNFNDIDPNSTDSWHTGGGSTSGNASGSAGGSSVTGGTGNVSGGSTSTPSTGGNVTGGTTSTPSTGGSVTGGTATGSSTSVVNGKTGADALADYLSALKIDSDFSKNLNTSRENIESKYNTLFEDLRTGDYTQKPYYQTILESYGIKGDAAANNASASGAAANAGNLDSYAAANAQRQQLAFKNAAESAALNAYNSEVASLLQTLSDLGVNVNDLYKTWASELDSQRSGAVNAYLGQLGADTDKYVSDNALAGDKYTADTNKYLGDIQATVDKYLGDINKEIEQDKINANVQMNAANNAANKELADLEVKYNTEMAELDRAHELLKQEMVNASAADIAKIEKEIREIEATKAELTAKYEADMKYATELAKASADANKKAEEEKKVEGDASAKLKPTDSMYNSALKAYNDGGVSGLADYLATVPAYDIDLLYEYAIKNGLYYAENVADKNEYPSLQNPVTHGGVGVASDKNVSLYN